MNKTIIKTSLSANMLLYTVFALCSVGTIICLMWIFPNMTKDNTYADMLETLPKEMLDSLGLVGNVNKLADYLNMNYYNAIYLYIMIAFNIVVITRLISKPVSDTSIVYYLNSPVSRSSFFVSQSIVYIIGLVIMTGTSILSAILTHKLILSDYDFEVDFFVKNNIVIAVLFLLLGSICLLICSICNNNGNALAYCAGIMVLEYIAFMVKNMNEKMDKLKYVTLFSLYDTDKIHSDSSFFTECTSICVVVSIVLIIVSVIYFKKKDLYL